VGASNVAKLDAAPSVVPTGVRSHWWNFGDGITSDQGPRVVHRYDRPGSYQVRLTITDLASRTRSRTVLTIEVQNLPVASFTGPTSTSAGGLASFDASRSAAGNGTNGSIRWYRWTFGDGTAPVDVHRNSGTTHRYAARGKYLVTLTATSYDGRTATTTVPIAITWQPSQSSPPAGSADRQKGYSMDLGYGGLYHPDPHLRGQTRRIRRAELDALRASGRAARPPRRSDHPGSGLRQWPPLRGIHHGKPADHRWVSLRPRFVRSSFPFGSVSMIRRHREAGGVGFRLGE
jgi:hypothetical protein